ncbi:hypothetical protein HC256_001549 [Beauveria bassiana]|nr:hypothetical protein HC256_010600 [Beauveria bassiana]KAH8708824.1 hypothetical protein HC256_008762 [Beauveria bassiana]KAH8712562.1 hypothetical protein HC256_005746 [Beauveria bassiana]KAH8713312.1 hypothetical protein HC256_006473 [Beauveria bassiana]KAH8713532.1 hypothetical protein HC256_006676 [Beauveria bassiana]
MPAAHQAKITEPAGDGTLNRRSSETNAKMHGGKRKNTASTRPTPSKVTKRKQSTKKAPPIGSLRDFPCRPCVTRATKAPGHECASQDNTGAACWDCAKMGHTCKPVPAGAIAAPDDAWRNAAQYAAQQLRACGAAPSAAALSVPAIASRAESPEKTFKERKTLALEALADAARLWIRLNKPESEGEGDDAGEADEEDD